MFLPLIVPDQPEASIRASLGRARSLLRDWARDDWQSQDWLHRAREQHAVWTRSGRPADLLDGTDFTEGMSWSARRGMPPTSPPSSIGPPPPRPGAGCAAPAPALVTVLVTVLALVASGTAVTALVERGQAVAQRRSALARTVAAEAQNLLRSQPRPGQATRHYRLPTGPDDRHRRNGGRTASPGHLRPHRPVLDLAAAGDARTLLLSTGRNIAVWNASGGRISSVAGVAAGPLAVGPDGRVPAAGTATGAVRLWSPADRRRPAPPANLMSKPRAVAAVAISADARLLAAGGPDGAVRLCDISAPAAPRPLPSLTGHPGGVDSLAFSPTRRLRGGRRHERRHRSGGQSRTGVTVGRQRPAGTRAAGGHGLPDLHQHRGNRRLHTGHFLVTTTSGSVDVWSTVPEDDEDQLCTAVGDVIDQEEWRRYVPHERYAPPCARSDPGRIHTVPAATP
ncbi:hypothetical protein QFZ63_006853 [Streptomyces sp. B3I7]|uniref:WD40 repeat domain-containing protein n=1 Tax=Streptomyces sp. B3I7 TaxID=3042269 RepID=UPI00277EB35B|nr:hypothetical protein [Streptomyces sp. B3I7]MDQ0815139.1 hypothetical protein [Streptomyces sp. B3I7]